MRGDTKPDGLLRSRPSIGPIEPTTILSTSEVDGADSIESIFNREYRRLVGLAILLVDDRDSAEELVQDAFLALHRSAVPVLNPEGFLRRCVVNGGRDVQRRRAVRRRNQAQPAEPIPFRFAELDDVLAELPFRQRAALLLRYVEDMPETEIADALGVRPTTVRTLVRRGLAQLRTEIEK